MARKKTQETTVQKTPTAEELLAQQMFNAAVLANALQKQQQSQVSAQAMVGIRNVSDMTVGIRGEFGAKDVHLHAATTPNDPNTVTIIPFAWWAELRKGKLVNDGVIVRDDTIMGEGYLRAPEDRPEEMAPNHQVNAIKDPKQWIESRDEAAIRRDLVAITSVNSLRRVRRAVDDKIKELAASMPDSYRDQTPASNGFLPKGGWDMRKVRALQELPALYRLVDDLTTQRIESMI